MIKRNNVDSIVSAIKHGALVVYPTDTLYALGASIFHEDAVKNVFLLKQRPLDMPLPVAVSSISQIRDLIEIPFIGRVLANHFLPGSLTLIVKNHSIPSIVTGGKDTIAIRIPDDPIALNLLEKTGPLTVTSANIHGHPPPETIDEIRNMFKSELIVQYIDDGMRTGEPSTIVDVTSPKPVILRLGRIPSEQIDTVVADNNG